MCKAREFSEEVAETIKNVKKRYVRVNEGAQLFSVGVNAFRVIAEEAGAVRRLKGITLYNIDIIENYIEMVGKVEK